MIGPRMRPRFVAELSEDSSATLKTIEDYFKDTMYPINYADHHVNLSIPYKEKHFWSPNLGLEVLDLQEGSVVHGLFGPSPGIWTMFMALYAIFGISSLGLFFYGFSSWQIGIESNAFLYAGIGIILFVLTYFIALVGQSLGYSQMHELKEQVAQALGVPID